MAENGDSWSPLQVELARQLTDIAREEGWEPGRRFKAAALARRLGVSRSPVNGALAYLTQAGVVRREPRKGYVLLDPGAGAPATGDAPAEDLMSRIMRDRARGELDRDVSEAELTERYGASRGEVRKALQRMASDGLVTRSRGHGWRFDDALDTDAAVEESYDFRILVECAALASPRFKADPEALKHLLAAHHALMDMETVSRETWFRLNAGFHETLAAWSGNRFLHQAVRQQNALRRLHEYAEFGTLAEGRIAQSSREHIAILEAIKEGDLPLAEGMLRCHLLLARKIA